MDEVMMVPVQEFKRLQDYYKGQMTENALLTLSLLERPRAANRKWPIIPRAAKSGQIKRPIFNLPSLPSVTFCILKQ